MSVDLNRQTRPYQAVLSAALTGGEDDIRAALADLDESALSRLRNAMRTIADLAEQQRRHQRMERGLS